MSYFKTGEILIEDCGTLGEWARYLTIDKIPNTKEAYSCKNKYCHGTFTKYDDFTIFSDYGSKDMSVFVRYNESDKQLEFKGGETKSKDKLIMKFSKVK